MKNKSTIRRNEKQWREIIAAQEASGQTVLAYCRGKGFSDKSFYMWRRRVKGKLNARTEKFMEVVSSIENPGEKGVLRVYTPRGYRLEVPRGLNTDTLRTVLKALEAEV
jgi:hypothetical protein